MLLSDSIINLRMCNSNDAEQMFEWENDADNWFVSGTTKKYSLDEIKIFVGDSYQDIHLTNQLRLIIELTSLNKTIGYIDLFEVDFINRRAGVGILIGDKTLRKKGFAKRSVELIKNYAFKTLQLHQLFCHIHQSNKPSIQLFESSGFKNCGCLKEWSLNNTNFEDVLIFQFIAE